MSDFLNGALYQSFYNSINQTTLINHVEQLHISQGQFVCDDCGRNQGHEGITKHYICVYQL